jgi:hypothetical protein
MTPEEEVELRQLCRALPEATKRATEALRKIGVTLDGVGLQRFRDEVAKVRVIKQRIDEIRGLERED